MNYVNVFADIVCVLDGRAPRNREERAIVVRSAVREILDDTIHTLDLPPLPDVDLREEIDQETGDVTLLARCEFHDEWGGSVPLIIREDGGRVQVTIPPGRLDIADSVRIRLESRWQFVVVSDEAAAAILS